MARKRHKFRFKKRLFSAADNLVNLFIYFFYKIQRKKTFIFQGENYAYFYHPYNKTWRNERAVELALLWPIVKANYRQPVLEVGNVLSHYLPGNHFVLDKKEKMHGVLNQDILDFNSGRKYHLIVSISTLEHVGWDDRPRQPENVRKAIRKLKNLLEDNGKAIITIPLGYNPYLDTLILKRKIKFNQRYFLKRISLGNDWVEVKERELGIIKYNHPFRFANCLFIGVIEKRLQQKINPEAKSRTIYDSLTP